MISIIIPTYNGSEFLKKYSLPSLLKQTYDDWEAIVVNDFSNDDSSEIIKNFISKDERIKLIEQKENKGLAAALNIGIEKSIGDIIAILEHDDIWLPEKLKMQKNELEKGAKITTCNAIIYSTKVKKFIKINNGNFSCLMFKKDVIKLLFPIPEENKKYLGIEDGIISAKIEIAKTDGFIRENEFTNIPEILTIMNSNEETLSGKKDCLAMKKRYYNILGLFSEYKGSKYKKINNLLNFWKKHYYYNLLLSYLPKSIKKIIYFIVDNSKRIKEKNVIRDFYKSRNYKKINEYRNIFD